MRILGIVGIWDIPRMHFYMWNRLKRAFGKTLPGVGFEVEHLWYEPWQFRKMRDYADRIVAKYDTGEELVIVGYSLGGVVATAIAPRFRKSRVRCVATIFAPHRYLFRFFSRQLGSNPDNMRAIPVLSFGARLDYLVPYGTEFPGAAKHVRLWSDHLFRLLLSDKPAQQIAQEAKNFLKKGGG